ncbi:hypothetical protein SAMD00019534_014040 [Acytostelium subglobosum LB1]|uniref:hypothetical protein n=1 Tax=Acytostelium subglobosum LB1 TaxID=1410327 RepID=UPI0006451B07|nr:hypothetical protein SAMD00019534_014040 [Acytostelium subglobosum LB1]GAM18229.1 hypothetical protein SAMD00019534_014040 [Acytostelium subglobosum LB1]|eukprot:XP_012758825.1 hypothetical protein SAMD00019534_014040 [Acytostelium subglobosum LB1]
MTVHTGWVARSPMQVRGYAFFDDNNDGTNQNTPAEYRIKDIDVELTNVDNNAVVATGKTDTSKLNDAFKFTDLPTGQYCIKMTDPTGRYKPAPIGTSTTSPNNQLDADGKYCFTLDSTTATEFANTLMTIHSGFVPAQLLAIRGYPFFDVNKNGNNENTAEQYRINGINVDLLKDGEIIRSGTTDTAKVNDAFRFDNLAGGDYCIKMSDPSGVYIPGPKGSSNSQDADGQYCFTLDSSTATEAGNTLMTIHSGWVAKTPLTLRGYAFYDANNNGTNENTPDEFRIKDIDVQLTSEDNGGVVIRSGKTVITQSNDAFIYRNLPSGKYCIKMTDPSGTYKPTIIGTSTTNPNNPLDADGMYCFTLDSTTATEFANTLMIIHSGWVALKPIDLRGYAFFDANNDGSNQNDAAEFRINGIDVSVINSDAGDVVIRTAKTDTALVNDAFKFTNLAGNVKYCVQMNDPSGVYKPTIIGTSATLANNPLDATGKYCFTLDSTTATESGTLMTIHTGWVRK